MAILESSLDVRSDTYRENRESMLAKLQELDGLYEEAAEGGGKETEGEDIEVMHVPLDEALEMIRSGEIMDAKTIILLQELALRRLTG